MLDEPYFFYIQLFFITLVSTTTTNDNKSKVIFQDLCPYIHQQLFGVHIDCRYQILFLQNKKNIQLNLHPFILCFCYRIILVTYCTTEEETGLYDGEFKSESCLFPGTLHVICLNYNCIKNLQLHCMFVHELLQFR